MYYDEFLKRTFQEKQSQWIMSNGLKNKIYTMKNQMHARKTSYVIHHSLYIRMYAKRNVEQIFIACIWIIQLKQISKLELHIIIITIQLQRNYQHNYASDEQMESQIQPLRAHFPAKCSQISYLKILEIVFASQDSWAFQSNANPYFRKFCRSNPLPSYR